MIGLASGMAMGLSARNGRRAGVPGQLFLFRGGDDTLANGLVIYRPTSASYQDYDGVIRYAGANVPRDQACLNRKCGLLCEGESTNLLAFSNDFTPGSDGVNWSTHGGDTGTSVLTNAAVGPDGKVSASILSNDGTQIIPVYGIFQGFSQGVSDEFTISLWMKAGTLSEAQLFISDFNDDSVLAGGVVTLTNDWQRFSFTFAVTGGGRIQISTNGVAGNIQISCSQAENLPFASSYIPTLESPVTRAADIPYFPIGFKPSTMSVYFKGAFLGGGGDARLFDMGKLDGTTPLMGNVVREPGEGFGSGYTLQIYGMSGGVEKDIATSAIQIGDVIETATGVDGSLLIGGVSINSFTPASVSTACTLLDAPFSEVYLGNNSYAVSPSFVHIQALCIVKGTRDIPWFRDALNPSILFEYNAGDSFTALGGSVARSTSSSYIDSRGNVAYAPANTPLDQHYIKGRRKLLIQPERTNLCTASKGQFASSVWNSASNPVDNIAIAPDRTMTASSVLLNTASSGGSYYPLGAVSGPVTLSLWIRANSPTPVTIGLDAFGGANVQTFTASYRWKRVSFTTSNNDNPFFLIQNAGVAGTVYIWEAQVEEGSFATTNITTNGSPVTRAADVPTFPWIGWEAMTFYTKFTNLVSGDASPYGIFAAGAQRGAPYARQYLYAGGVYSDLIQDYGGCSIPVSYEAERDDTVESVLSILAAGGGSASVSINSGSSASNSGAGAFVATPGGTNTLTLGELGYQSGNGCLAFDCLIIAKKVQTLQWFRDYVEPGKLFRYSAGDSIQSIIRVTGAGQPTVNGDYTLASPGTWQIPNKGNQIFLGGDPNVTWTFYDPEGAASFPYAATVNGTGLPSTFTFSGGPSLAPNPTVTLINSPLNGAIARASTASYRDANGDVQYAAVNEFRDRHYVDGNRTALMEGESTNALNYSRAFTNAFWNSANSSNRVTDNVAIAPDNTLTATEIVDFGAALSQIFCSVAVGDGWTGSVWIKGTKGAQTYLWLDDGNANSGVTVTFTGEWERIATPSFSAAQYFIIGTLSRGSAPQLAGSTYYIWEAQLENLPFATSNITTNGSPVTRAADIPSFQVPFKPQVLTVFARFYDLGTSQTNAFVFFLGGAGDPEMTIYNPSGYALYYAGAQSSGVPLSNVGDLVELNGTLAKNWVSTLTESLNGAALVTDTPGDPGGSFSDWSDPTLILNQLMDHSSNGFMALRDIIFVKGIVPMNKIRNIIRR